VGTVDAGTPIIRLEGLQKRYAGVHAVRGVGFDIRAGELLGLVGANGAGKSTLTRMISGGEAPDDGRIEIDGTPVTMRSAADGLRRGIVLVPQALTVAPNLSVRENLILGLERNRRSGGSDGAAVGGPREIARVMEALGLEIDLEQKAGGHSPAVLKLIMIGAGLLRAPRVLILDEPTAILAGAEVQRLFAVIRRLHEQGQAIVYISHRLPEIVELADRVAVMRNGQLVGVEERGTSAARLAELMVGGVVEQAPRSPDAARAARGDVVLDVRGLARRPKVPATDLTVRAGEIVALAGLVGAGRTSLLRTIVGLDPADAGEVRVADRVVTPRTPRQAIDAGIAHIPEDRARLAIVPRMTVAENVALPHRRVGRRVPWLPLITPGRQRRAVQGTLADLQIEPAHAAELPAGGLSGGNQQKAVLARWLMSDARVFVFDEPTEGIDVAARAQVHSLIRGLADRGAAVLLSSSDVEEVALMADRVLVLRHGRIDAELEGDDVNETTIGLASLGERRDEPVAP